MHFVHFRSNILLTGERETESEDSHIGQFLYLTFMLGHVRRIGDVLLVCNCIETPYQSKKLNDLMGDATGV